MKKFFLVLIAIALAAVLGAGVILRARAERKGAALVRRAHRQILQESMIRVFREHDDALRHWTSRADGAGADLASNRQNFYQALAAIDTSLCPDDFTSAWTAYVELWNPRGAPTPALGAAPPSGLSGRVFGRSLAQKEEEDTAFETCRAIAVNYGVHFNLPPSAP